MNNTTAVVRTQESKTPQPPQLRKMSMEKAALLIRKTSAQHDGLFRRLAK